MGVVPPLLFFTCSSVECKPQYFKDLEFHHEAISDLSQATSATSYVNEYGPLFTKEEGNRLDRTNTC